MFDRQKEREGAYDFLENDAVDVASLANSVFAATVGRAQGEPFVYVAIDGSSLSLTDDLGSKGFGPVGSPNTPVKGLMEMGALAVTRKGVPLGLVDQAFWVREPTELMTSAERTKRNQARSFEEKEPHRFVVAAKNAHERLAAVGTRVWVLIDREGDSRDILLALHQTGCCFTVRAKWNRKVQDEVEPNVQSVLDSAPALGAFDGAEAPHRGRCHTVKRRHDDDFAPDLVNSDKARDLVIRYSLWRTRPSSSQHGRRSGVGGRPSHARTVAARRRSVGRPSQGTPGDPATQACLRRGAPFAEGESRRAGGIPGSLAKRGAEPNLGEGRPP